MKLKVLDLFSGIGGFSLGLERAGMETVAFCEIEPYPQAVLKKNFPGVPIYDDVRTLTAERLRTDGVGRIDLICGGFPCQDLSLAGNMEGFKAGTRSSLFREMLRLACDLSPRYIIFENVSALLTGDNGRWFSTFLNELAAIRFDAEWHCIPASFIDAPHHRDRIWIVAYPSKIRQYECCNGNGESVQEQDRQYQNAPRFGERFWLEIANCRHTFQFPSRPGQERSIIESSVGRTTHGIPCQPHRIAALGNTIMPGIAEIIGRAIMQIEAPYRMG